MTTVAKLKEKKEQHRHTHNSVLLGSGIFALLKNNLIDLQFVIVPLLFSWVIQSWSNVLCACLKIKKNDCESEHSTSNGVKQNLNIIWLQTSAN